MMIENRQKSITTTDTPIFTTGDEFLTKVNSSVKRYMVQSSGNAEIVSVVFYSPDDTSIKDNYIKIVEQNTKKILYKIVSINDLGEPIVEIFLDHCETQKKLNSYYTSILKEKNLLYIGAEFYIVYDKIKDGLNVRIEESLSDYKINDIYNTLYQKMVN